MKKLILILTILFFYSVAFSQDGNPWIGLEKSYIPEFKSPEVAGFMRYGSYPVNLAVGIPDITIPIYTIESGNLIFPITLSYHLGGIKVNDIASWVGLGWSLNANGYINRTLKGRPDEGGFLKEQKFTLRDNAGNTINGIIPISENDFYKYEGKGSGYQEMKYYLERIQNDIYDGQSDVYSFQANNISGSFMYNLDREIVQLPSSDNKIIRNTDNTFIITSDDGTQYIFNDTETASYIREINNETHTSNWLLSYIISPNSTDTIKFNYTTTTSYEDGSYSTSLSEGYAISVNPNNGYDWPPTYSEINGFIEKVSKGSGSFSNERLLSSIEFNNGVIDFNIVERNIKDKRKYKLESIVVWAKKQNKQRGEQIKKIVFDYDHFSTKSLPSPFQNTPTERLKLEYLKIYGGNNINTPQIYKFTYFENSSLPPYAAAVSDYRFNGQDHWGYYNGVTTNQNLVGAVPDGAKTKHWAANREPSESSMKAGLLERIDYPTGGYTIFKTEANRDAQNKLYGGLRIAQIISKPSNTENAITETFTYESPNVLFEPTVNLYRYNMHTYIRLYSDETPDPKYRLFYTEHPFSAVGNYMGSSVVYRKVTKTETDNTGNYNGKVVYSYQGNNTFKYLSSEYYIDGGRESYYMPITWRIGKPLKEQYFVKGKNDPEKIISYEYSTYQSKYNNSNNIPVGKMVLNRFFPIYPVSAEIDINKVDARVDFACYWIYTNTGCEKLTKKTDSIYDNKSNQYIVSVTNYKYDNINSTKKNLLVTEKIQEINSNDKLIEKYTYPQDYTSTIYSDMTTKNMLAYPIEQVVKSNTKEVSKRKRDYNSFPKIYPVSELSSYKGNTYRTDITYDLYDEKGNIRQLTTLDGVSTIYLWSYNYQYPVAEIKNTTYTQVRDALGGQTIVDNIAKSIVLSDADKVKINNLRTSLSGAHVTTYTYKPLVGMLSATDPSGITTYYDYDSFGRLKETYIYKDNIVSPANKQIIQKYDYHYQNQ